MGDWQSYIKKFTQEEIFWRKGCVKNTLYRWIKGKLLGTVPIWTLPLKIFVTSGGVASTT
jgi:hypothetical protein